MNSLLWHAVIPSALLISVCHLFFICLQFAEAVSRGRLFKNESKQNKRHVGCFLGKIHLFFSSQWELSAPMKNLVIVIDHQFWLFLLRTLNSFNVAEPLLQPRSEVDGQNPSSFCPLCATDTWLIRSPPPSPTHHTPHTRYSFYCPLGGGTGWLVLGALRASLFLNCCSYQRA